VDRCVELLETHLELEINRTTSGVLTLNCEPFDADPDLRFLTLGLIDVGLSHHSLQTRETRS
jgi:hypothetical protein